MIPQPVLIERNRLKLHQALHTKQKIIDEKLGDLVSVFGAIVPSGSNAPNLTKLSCILDLAYVVLDESDNKYWVVSGMNDVKAAEKFSQPGYPVSVVDPVTKKKTTKLMPVYMCIVVDKSDVATVLLKNGRVSNLLDPKWVGSNIVKNPGNIFPKNLHDNYAEFEDNILRPIATAFSGPNAAVYSYLKIGLLLTNVDPKKYRAGLLPANTKKFGPKIDLFIEFVKTLNELLRLRKGPGATIYQIQRSGNMNYLTNLFNPMYKSGSINGSGTASINFLNDAKNAISKRNLDLHSFGPGRWGWNVFVEYIIEKTHLEQSSAWKWLHFHKYI